MMGIDVIQAFELALQSAALHLLSSPAYQEDYSPFAARTISICRFGLEAPARPRMHPSACMMRMTRKAHIGPKSERSKMPRVPAKSPTPEEQQATRRARAADRTQTKTSR